MSSAPMGMRAPASDSTGRASRLAPAREAELAKELAERHSVAWRRLPGVVDSPVFAGDSCNWRWNWVRANSAAQSGHRAGGQEHGFPTANWARSIP